MATYWRLLRQSSCGPPSPSYCCRQGALPSQPSASVSAANSSITRNGVQKRDRPISACLPSGPPTIRLVDATSGSDHDGTSRGCGAVTARSHDTSRHRHRSRNVFSTERGQPLADRRVLQPRGYGAVAGQDVVDARRASATPSSTRTRPATTVSPRPARTAAQPGLDRVGAAHRRARSGRPPRPRGRRRRRPSARRSPRRAPGTPRRRGSRGPARRGPSPRPRRRAACPSSIAVRASSHSDADVVRRRPVARPARPGAPAARRSRTGQIRPLPRIMFELGQCATPTPAAPEPGDLGRVGIDAVRHPGPRRQPAHLGELVDRAPAEALEAVRRPRRGPRRGGCAAGRRAARPAPRSRVISAGETLNGEHGASAIRSIDAGDAVVVRRDQPLASRRGSRRRPGPRESGGRPPSFSDSVIDPRVGWNRRPSSRGRGDLGRPQVAGAARVRRRGGRRSRCSRPGPARPARPRPRGTTPPRRCRAHSG